MRSTAGAIDRPRNAGGTLAVQQQLVVTSLWTILGLAIAVAALLLTRRISGAFQTPFGGAAIVLLALVTEAAVFTYRWLWSGRKYAVVSQYSVLTQFPFLFALTTLIALSILISLTIPGTPVLGLFLAWFIVIAGEIAQWQFHFRPIWSIH